MFRMHSKHALNSKQFFCLMRLIENQFNSKIFEQKKTVLKFIAFDIFNLLGVLILLKKEKSENNLPWLATNSWDILVHVVASMQPFHV